jgi:hypothetical protein
MAKTRSMPPPLLSCDGRRICSRTYFDGWCCRASWRRLADSFMAAYSHFAWRCRVIRDTSAAYSALRACVVRAVDVCALGSLHQHRKPPPCSMGGCSRFGGQILVTRRCRCCGQHQAERRSRRRSHRYHGRSRHRRRRLSRHQRMR